MIQNKIFVIALIVLSCFLIACQKDQSEFDASGTFESEEIIVSSEISGRILSFDKGEGEKIQSDEVVVRIDPATLELHKLTLEASLASIGQKANSAQPQVSVIEQQMTSQRSQIASLQAQMTKLKRDKERTERLLLAEAATQKQLDDINSQIDILSAQIESAEQQIKVMQSQIEMQKDVVSIQNRGLFSEQEPLQKQISQIEDQINRAQIKSPIAGMILTKYMYAGEFATPGKALFKLADMDNMILRAYVSGHQLSEIQLGQKVDVFVDEGADAYRQIEGTISWISNEAEFTPKTIQTRDERTDLVYAIKVNVRNDGFLKIGMYGELKLNSDS